MERAREGGGERGERVQDEVMRRSRHKRASGECAAGSREKRARQIGSETVRGSWASFGIERGPAPFGVACFRFQVSFLPGPISDCNR
jgi:hypothetical protein